MDTTTFVPLFDDIVLLNNSEGPSRNVFEPKFQARDQMLALKDTITKLNQENPSLLALQQICRCLCFIAVNMIDTEEEEEAVEVVRLAYTIVVKCIEKEKVSDISTLQLVTLEAIKESVSGGKHLLRKEDGFHGCVEYCTVLNTLGYYFSLTSGPLAKGVLELAEHCYQDWDAYFKGPSLIDLKIDDNGKLVETDAEEATPFKQRMRFDMENVYTSTVFFLAQVYGPLGLPMARACHLTVYRQLLLKREFSRISWAENVIQLSAYYFQMAEFGRAFHCLKAGEHVMPKDGDPEKTTGKVAMAYGTFYVTVLTYYGELYSKGVTEEPKPNTELVSSIEKYWVDFPSVAPAEDFPPIKTFDQARDIFKEGLQWLHTAAEIYTFETQCTSHITALRYQSQLYAALALFETNRSRCIAMLQRQIALTEKIPDQLNFNAYPTDHRQLLLDLGELHMSMLELRGQQRQHPLTGEAPLKDTAYNQLVDRTVGYFKRFCDTWIDPRTKKIPDKLAEEEQLPFFTALIREAQAHIRYSSSSPAEVCDHLGAAITGLKRAVEFSKTNNMPEEKVHKELEVADQLMPLLIAKREQALRQMN